MLDIRPGLGVEFIYYSDYVKENIHVMRSVIYDVMDKRLILSQSSPSVFRSSIKKEILVTYLKKNQGEYGRFGFLAKIEDLIGQYKIGSGEQVPAIIIEQKNAPRPFNIRLHYRLKVPSVCDLTLCIRGEKTNLIDISIGGAKISVAAFGLLKPHSRIKLRLCFNNREFDLDSEVLRVWSTGIAEGNKDFQFASIKFLNTDRIFEHLLGKKIFTIERQLLAEGKVQLHN